ncbi:MAG TPA: hypothetical protein VHB97_26985, partial [Polyangia bacterium]|nr:hypothetical protein [Polyangia bacterium]
MRCVSGAREALEVWVQPARLQLGRACRDRGGRDRSVAQPTRLQSPATRYWRRRRGRATSAASANMTNASAHGDDLAAPPMLQPCDFVGEVEPPASAPPMSLPDVAGPAADVTGA